MSPSKIKKFLSYLFLSVVSIISVFPFIWMIIGATNTSMHVLQGKLSIGVSLGTNIRNLFQSTPMLIGIKNSTFIAIVTSILALIISSLAGYGFEIYCSKNKDKLFGFLLLSMMIPFAAIMIPLYRMFGNIGLLNTHTSVIVPSVATAFLIFFFRQNTKSFPTEIIEAARVDGLKELMIFVFIYFPAMKSTYAAAAIITFMATWNSYLWPLVALQTTEKLTLPLIISTLSSSYTPDYGVIMVAIIITTIPTALMFFIMQKSFVEGMVGSVK
jgi:lactose/L-arabinose transport system permease protein